MSDEITIGSVSLAVLAGIGTILKVLWNKVQKSHANEIKAMATSHINEIKTLTQQMNLLREDFQKLKKQFHDTLEDCNKTISKLRHEKNKLISQSAIMGAVLKQIERHVNKKPLTKEDFQLFGDQDGSQFAQQLLKQYERDALK